MFYFLIQNDDCYPKLSDTNLRFHKADGGARVARYQREREREEPTAGESLCMLMVSFVDQRKKITRFMSSRFFRL